MFKNCVATLALIFAFTTVACESEQTDTGEESEATATEETEGAEETEETVQAAEAGEDIAGIPAATKISDLDEEQSAAFCSALGKSLIDSQEGDEMKRAGCLLGGLMMAAFSGAQEEEAVAAACQQAYDECIAQPDQEMPEPDICPGADELASCEATVGEINACLDGMIEYGFGALRELSSNTCQDLATEEGGAKVEAAMARMQELGGGVPEIEACAPVQEKCPNFMNQEAPQQQPMEEQEEAPAAP